jgi:hypothetical protein
MKLKITITMDNAAFEDENGGGSEAARILQEVAATLQCDGPAPFQGGSRKLRKLRDINGNTVGEARVTR